MIYFTEADIDRMLEDDAPVGDATSWALELHKYIGQIRYLARHKMVVSGTEEAARIYSKVGLKISMVVPSGTYVDEGTILIEATGKASDIHMAWKAGSAMVEFASGIATRTHELVTAAKKEKPDIMVAGTRKHPPYLKKVALKALMAGGGIPHRTGLSDTILLFDEHQKFIPDNVSKQERIKKIKAIQKEKKVVAEAHTISEAMELTEAGADCIQVDKFSVTDFRSCVVKCKAINPNITLLAAGQVNSDNAAHYAKAGADVLVTSWIYFGKPADIKVLIDKIG